MSPFGSKPVETEGQAAPGERWELRNLTIVDGQEKTTASNKVYWRVKDTNNHWFSVWDAATKATLEIAADNKEQIPCAVHIKPGKNGGNPFYTIEGVGAVAAAMVEEGKGKVVASAAPGGRNSEFGKRMHPDDALRVTHLATMERAIQMVQLTIADKAPTTKCETFVKAKVLEYMNFLNGIVKMPLTPTPDAPSSESPPPLTDADVPVDDDIPF